MRMITTLKSFKLYLLGLFLCILSSSTKAQVLQPIQMIDSAALKESYIFHPAEGNGIGSNSTNRIDACVAPANDNFASASTLTVGTWTSGSTCGGSIQGGENLDCNTGAVSSVWYKFTATATNMYVCITLQTGTYYVGGAVWSTSSLPTGNCPALQCQSASLGPQSYALQINPATIGQTYYVQIINPNSTTDANTFWVMASTSATPAAPYIGAPTPTLTNAMPASTTSTCATAYSACYINNCNPTSAQVTAAGCPSQTTNLSFNTVYTTCYTFTNGSTNAQVGVQAYLLSCATCGNVNWLDWTLYNSSCALIGCGNLSNLTVTGAGCSTTFTICQTFEAAPISGRFCNVLCGNITSVTPYASWASCTTVPCTVLPIKLETFSAEYQQISNTVDIYWSTASETNNKLFTIEKSVDGNDWKFVSAVPGAGNSDHVLYYTATDENPYPGISYYRLHQTDYDGNTTYNQPVAVNIPADYSAHIFPNPTKDNMTLRYSTQSPDPINVTISDLSGKTITSYTITEIQQGVNDFDVKTSSLAKGMYFMKVSNLQKTFYLKFVKE